MARTATKLALVSASPATVVATPKPIAATKRAPVIADSVAADITPPAQYVITGKLSAIRNAALVGLASLAYTEGKARTDTLAQLAIILGRKPSDAEMGAAKLEYVTGRLAQTLPTSELPASVTTVAERLTFARALLTQYAAPAKDGIKSNLKAGQLGRRTDKQHKACRALDQVWSKLKADAGFGAAQTTKAKNDKTAGKGARMAGDVGGEAPTHAELSAPAKALTKEDCSNHLLSAFATLLAYVNKNAKLVGTDMGTMIRAGHKLAATEAAAAASINA